MSSTSTVSVPHNSRPTIYVKSVSIALILHAAPVCAQPSVSESDIVITARLAEPALSRAYSASVINAAQLEATGAVRLDDALRAEPGFQMFRRASSRTANPTAQGLTLRALGGNAASRIAVLVDGVPVEDPFAGWIPLSALPVSDIASVRLVRGGGAVAAGPGALAGSLAVETRSPERSGASLALAGGSFGTAEADVQAAAVMSRWSVQASLSHGRSDGFIAVEPARRGIVDTPLGYASTTARLGMDAALGGDWHLALRGARFTERKDGGFALAQNRNSGTDVSARLVKVGGDGSWSADIAAWRKQRNFDAVTAAANATRTSATVSLNQFDVPSSGEGVRAEVRSPIGAAIEVRAGGEARWAQGATHELFRYVLDTPTRLRHAGGNARTLGVFAEASAQVLPPLMLTLGARRDGWKLSNGYRTEIDRTNGNNIINRTLPVRTGGETTARAGVLVTPVAALTVRAAAYTGWRLPTLNELHRPFRIGNDVTEANSALVPERLKGIDAGFAHVPLPQVRLELTAFANWLDHAVANVTLGTGPGTFPDAGFIPAGGSYRQRQNLGRVRTLGLEAQAETPLGASWRVRAAGGWASAKVRRATNAGQIVLVGKRLAQSPTWQASLTLSYAPAQDRWGGSASVRASGNAFEDDLNLRPLGRSTAVDGQLWVKLGGRVRAQASIENALNAENISAVSGDGVRSYAAPRQIRIGLQTEF